MEKIDLGTFPALKYLSMTAQQPSSLLQILAPVSSIDAHNRIQRVTLTIGSWASIMRTLDTALGAFPLPSLQTVDIRAMFPRADAIIRTEEEAHFREAMPVLGERGLLSIQI